MFGKNDKTKDTGVRLTNVYLAWFMSSVLHCAGVLFALKVQMKISPSSGSQRSKVVSGLTFREVMGDPLLSARWKVGGSLMSHCSALHGSPSREAPHHTHITDTDNCLGTYACTFSTYSTKVLRILLIALKKLSNAYTSHTPRLTFTLDTLAVAFWGGCLMKPPLCYEKRCSNTEGKWN